MKWKKCRHEHKILEYFPIRSFDYRLRTWKRPDKKRITHYKNEMNEMHFSVARKCYWKIRNFWQKTKS